MDPGAWAIGGVIVGLAFYGLFSIIVQISARLKTRQGKDPV